MTSLMIDGYYDSLHHNPFTPIIFHPIDLGIPIRFGEWSFSSIYVHDTRHPNGSAPSDNASAQVRLELAGLRSDITSVTNVILREPDGLPGRPHCAGGGYTSGRVTFYVARGNLDGQWRKYLCANIY